MKIRSVLILSFVGLACGATHAEGATNYCQQTAQTALQSCQEGAQSGLLLALGKCDNVAGPTQRKACNSKRPWMRKTL